MQLINIFIQLYLTNVKIIGLRQLSKGFFFSTPEIRKILKYQHEL